MFMGRLPVSCELVIIKRLSKMNEECAHKRKRMFVIHLRKEEGTSTEQEYEAKQMMG